MDQHADYWPIAEMDYKHAKVLRLFRIFVAKKTLPCLKLEIIFKWYDHMVDTVVAKIYICQNYYTIH